MTVDTAYSTLGVSKEMDENTLTTVFDTQVSEVLSRGFRLPTLPKAEEQASLQVNKLREGPSALQKAHKVNI